MSWPRLEIQGTGHVIHCKYAVRGEIVSHVQTLYCNIGNTQSLGQQPLTFFKEVPYYQDEARGWALELSEVKKQMEAAKTKGISCRAMVVINPGNPTGQVLVEDNQREIVEFCKNEGLVLLADEGTIVFVVEGEVT